jgi:hypothetical protein
VLLGFGHYSTASVSWLTSYDERRPVVPRPRTENHSHCWRVKGDLVPAAKAAAKAIFQNGGTYEIELVRTPADRRTFIGSTGCSPCRMD